MEPESLLPCYSTTKEGRSSRINLGIYRWIVTRTEVYISLLVTLCGICALTALHISSVTSSGETQAALLGNLTQAGSTVTQQFHTTLNTTHSG